MLPSKDVGKSVQILKKPFRHDFSSLMPRPGWQDYLGMFVVYL